MIDVKQAVKAAEQYLHDLLGDRVSIVTLEEVELSEDERHWLITFGFTDRAGYGGITDVINPASRKKYKVFDVDADNGNVKSMKIRAVSSA